MPSCEVCGGSEFQLEEGHFYCQVCNTQSQVMRETEHDDELPTGARHAMSQIPSQPEKRQKTVEEAVDKGRPWETPEAFQCILKEQIKALVKLGADPQLEVKEASVTAAAEEDS